MTSTFRFGTGAAPASGTSFGVKPTAATSATPSISPGKLTYEQLDASSKKLVEEVQLKFSEKMLADEIQQRVPEPVTRVTEDTSLMIEKMQTLLGTVNQDNQEALSLKKEYTALLRNVDQLTALVERAGAMGSQLESRQGAWDNYQLANLPSKYFRDLVSTFESRMLEYRQTIETIEKFVDTSNSMRVFSPGMLKEVMQAQMEYFMTLTAQASVIHDTLKEMQESCLEAYKGRDLPEPKFVDPYAPKTKKEKAPPVPTFEYPEIAQPVATGATGTAATTTFGAKPAGTTGFGAGAAGTGTTGYGTSGTTGFGAKPAGTTGFGTPTGGGFGAAKPAGFGGTGASSFGAKPTGTTGFGTPAAAKTGTTGFGTGAGTAGAAKPTGFGFQNAGTAGSFKPPSGF